MILFTDASAVLKLIVHEIGSDEVHVAASEARQLGASALLYAEARSGLARKAAERRIAPPDFVDARQRLEHYWTDVALVEVTRRLGVTAGELAERHLLRGADAVHLASAIDLRDSGEAVLFACWDERLRRAARAMGLQTLPDR